MLWNFRWKGPRGVEVGVLDADDLAQAEAVGQAYCSERNFCRFIQIDGPLICATAEILKRRASAPDLVDDASERPSVQEQREKLRRARA